MPEIKQIKLTLDGPESEQGFIRLPDFLKWLENQHKTLVDFDKLISGQRSNYFRITDLRRDSPSTVMVEVCPNEPNDDTSTVLVDRYIGTVRDIAEGRVPPGMSVDMLRDFRELARPIGKGLRSATIGYGDTEISLSSDFVSQIDSALSQIHRSIGSVEGTVERFNAHAGANVFYIYPSFGPSKVKCNFNEEQKQDAVDAILKDVRVVGELVYFRDEPFPHEINVLEIQTLEDEDIPDIETLRGVAPGATDELSSEAFIRRERDAWDD